MAQPVSGYLYQSNLLDIKDYSVISGTGDTTGVNMQPSYFTSNGITVVFSVGAIVASGSLTVNVQESDTSGSGYTTPSGATIVLNTVGVYVLFIPNFQGKYIRLDHSAITGTSVGYSALVYGQPAAATSSEGYTTSPQGQSL